MIMRRRFCFENAKNIRDLGGFPTTDGKITKYGILLRSEELCSLTLSEKELLFQYGIRKVIDFRNASECYLKQHSLKNYKNIVYKNIPLFTDKTVPSINLETNWKMAYVDIVENHSLWIKSILDEILQTKNAVLFNCTTGKDRTGVIAALLLEIVHTCRDDIYADYAVSQLYLKQKYYSLIENLNYCENKEGILKKPFFSTNPENIQYLLEYIDAKYGSLSDYLSYIGIEKKAIDGFRSYFLIE